MYSRDTDSLGNVENKDDSVKTRGFYWGSIKTETVATKFLFRYKTKYTLAKTSLTTWMLSLVSRLCLLHEVC